MVGTVTVGPFGSSVAAIASERIIVHGGSKQGFSGMLGSAASPGDLMKFAADGAESDLYTFDAAVYGEVPVAILDFDPEQSATIDTAMADGDSAFFHVYEEGLIWRANYKDNVALIPGDKCTLSGTGGKLDKMIYATLTGTTPYGFSSSHIAKATTSYATPCYVVAVSWSSVVSVSSRSSAVQIWAQARSW